MGQIATKFSLLKNIDEKKAFLKAIPFSAISGGLTDEYYQTLTDFDFISLKISDDTFRVEALIRDYDLIHDPEILKNLDPEETLNPQQLKTLKFIQRTLELSSHILNEDPTQLVGQLWGRLQGFNYPDIEKLLEDAKDSTPKKVRLRPLTASLTTPDSCLIKTLITIVL
ncbi:hypothetical protein [Crocosphaera sp. Alani8]|uniref:hypothetical protein n=1 Tax=Crocosphaera sp. Alani8 TaxID=3038952 RepID=UPI00313E9534